MAANRKIDRIRPAFAQRLRQAIVEIGFSPQEQTALGELFGVSGQAVRKWIDGTAMPTRTNMGDVAAALGVRRAWLEYGEPPTRPQQATVPPAEISEIERAGYQIDEPFKLEAEEVRLLLTLRRVPPERRAALEQIIEALAGAEPRACK